MPSESQKNKKQDGGTSRNIFALGMVSFFTDFSSEMIMGLLPSLILSLPGGNSALLGLIEGFAESLSYIFRAVSGIFSDKFKRRKSLILVGYGLSNVIKPLFALASSVFDAFVIRVTDRIGKGIRTAPRDALIADSVSEGRRGAAFGFHRTLDQAGAVTGPVLASSLLLLGYLVTDIFWLSFIPGMIALLIIVFVVKEYMGKTTGEFQLLKGLRTVLSGNFSIFLGIVTLFSLGAFNYSFILLNARESMVPDQLIPMIYAVVNLFHVVIAIPSGLLADKIGKEKVLLIGYGAFLTSAVAIFLMSGNYFVSFIIAALFGVYDGIANTSARALVPKYAESGLKGTAYGIYYLVVGVAFFVSNTLVGLMWQYFGPTTATLYSVTLASISILAMIVFIIKTKKG